jgi:hypothetical protein
MYWFVYLFENKFSRLPQSSLFILQILLYMRNLKKYFHFSIFLLRVKPVEKKSTQYISKPRKLFNFIGFKINRGKNILRVNTEQKTCFGSFLGLYQSSQKRNVQIFLEAASLFSFSSKGKLVTLVC